MHYYRQYVSAALLFWAPAISLSSILRDVFPQISSLLIPMILTLNSQGLSHHVLCCPNTFQMDIGSLASDTAVITSRGGNPLSVYLSYFHVERLVHHFGPGEKRSFNQTSSLQVRHPPKHKEKRWNQTRQRVRIKQLNVSISDLWPLNGSKTTKKKYQDHKFLVITSQLYSHQQDSRWRTCLLCHCVEQQLNQPE